MECRAFLIDDSLWEPREAAIRSNRATNEVVSELINYIKRLNEKAASKSLKMQRFEAASDLVAWKSLSNGHWNWTPKTNWFHWVYYRANYQEVVRLIKIL